MLCGCCCRVSVQEYALERDGLDDCSSKRQSKWLAREARQAQRLKCRAKRARAMTALERDSRRCAGADIAARGRCGGGTQPLQLPM